MLFSGRHTGASGKLVNTTKRSFLAALLAATALLPLSVPAFVLEGPSWPSGTTVMWQVRLKAPPFPLNDGTPSYDVAFIEAINNWNPVLGRIQVSGTIGPAGQAVAGDNLNTVCFSDTVFGMSFGSSTLAVTQYFFTGSPGSETFTEADMLFNNAVVFDCYHGPLQFQPNGFALNDFRRVATHELGHSLGLDHPDTHGQTVVAIMNSRESDVELPTADDIAGIQTLYGVPAMGHLENISARVEVGTAASVAIGGFVVAGDPVTVVIRGIGPSLTGAGVPGVLADPFLDLHDTTGSIETNDNWQDNPSEAAAISNVNLAPQNPSESAIYRTLPAGSYTAILEGVGSTTGVGLVEVYKVDAGTGKLVNISTRGQVLTGDQVLIGGLVASGVEKVCIRAIGPSLSNLGVQGALQDPTLTLYNSQGQQIDANDNWQDNPTEESQMVAANINPTDPRESAIFTSLSPGAYTAIVTGKNGSTGIGLVEIFDEN